MSRQAPGLTAHARALAAAGVRAVRTRLELLDIEIATEKARIVRALAMAAAAFYLLSFGGVLAVLWAAQALPHEFRLAALGALAVAFLVAGALAFAWLARGGTVRRPILATIVAVLRRDEQALAGRSL
jgi:uncharacterized membrane protein YqjE